jgi:uncharacterized caspase-like protein
MGGQAWSLAAKGWAAASPLKFQGSSKEQAEKRGNFSMETPPFRQNDDRIVDIIILTENYNRYGAQMQEKVDFFDPQRYDFGEIRREKGLTHEAR